MRELTILVSDSFVRLLHANAQMHRDDDEIDAAQVLARVVSQIGLGISPQVIYLSVPHMWRDDIDAPDEQAVPWAVGFGKKAAAK